MLPPDEDAVGDIIVAIFDLNRRLQHAVVDLHAIRLYLLDEEDDGEEEEEDH